MGARRSIHRLHRRSAPWNRAFGGGVISRGVVGTDAESTHSLSSRRDHLYLHHHLWTRTRYVRGFLNVFSETGVLLVTIVLIGPKPDGVTSCITPALSGFG